MWFSVWAWRTWTADHLPLGSNSYSVALYKRDSVKYAQKIQKWKVNLRKPPVLVREPCFHLLRRSTTYIKSLFVNRHWSLRQKSLLISQFLDGKVRQWQNTVNGHQWAIKWSPLAVCVQRAEPRPSLPPSHAAALGIPAVNSKLQLSAQSDRQDETHPLGNARASAFMKDTFGDSESCNS